jgi:hypothetical protein
MDGNSMTQAPKRARWWIFGTLSAAAAYLLLPVASANGQGQDGGASKPTLEETRLTMGKWIETQQILSRERNEWQQGKEILLGRLELVRNEVGALEGKIQQAEKSVAEANQKRDELLAQSDQLKATGSLLAEAVQTMEAEVRRLFQALPEPIQTKLQPLFQRIPEDPTNTRASVAERYQNVLGILKLVNDANNEINVNYEVRSLADGKPSEVRALYIGLAQAYYVSANGEAGIGRPGVDGWKWEPSKAVANDVLVALEILQGKHTPTFVPLPVQLQ